MTGGRRRREEYEPLPFAPVIPPPTPDEVATLSALSAFKRAMRFRRVLQRALRPLKVSFAEWRVLEATHRLFKETEVPVSHLQVARELDLGETSVSRLMWQLSRRGMVDHDLDGICLGYRVLMTPKSKALMAAAYAAAAQLAPGIREH